jgi:hypothetical protein
MPNNSVKRTAFRGRLLRALGGRAIFFVVLRAFRVLASCWQSRVCCSKLACVVVFCALGRLACLARVGAHRIFMLSRARGLLQCGVRRQRHVLRAQAANFAALPGFQSSAIVFAHSGVSVLPSNISFKADGFAAA